MASAIIVIPCYNEAARLQVHTFQTFTCASTPCAFSSSATAVRATPGRCWKPSTCLTAALRFIRLPKNAGKAEAVRQGVLHFCHGLGLWGYWDADLATPLEAIPAFCDLLDARTDLLIVFGARVRLLGRTITRRAVRHYLGASFHGRGRGVGSARYDTQCGA